LRAADCGLCFRSNSGPTLGGLDTAWLGNSKAPANLLCVYAVPDDARARTVSVRSLSYSDYVGTLIAT